MPSEAYCPSGISGQLPKAQPNLSSLRAPTVTQVAVNTQKGRLDLNLLLTVCKVIEDTYSMRQNSPARNTAFCTYIMTFEGPILIFRLGLLNG